MTTEAELKINYLFAGIAVANYDSALAWYARFFGRSPDVIVAEQEAMWHVPDIGSIYVVGDAERAGNALITLAVDDLEDLVVEFTERGLAVSMIDATPGTPKKTVVTDPEGNRFTLFENRSSDS
jgi:predicted enzyme related to lactoylglutathione lyase